MSSRAAYTLAVILLVSPIVAFSGLLLHHLLCHPATPMSTQTPKPDTVYRLTQQNH